MSHALIALLMLAFWTASLWSADTRISLSPPADPIGQVSKCGAIAGKIPKTDASGIYQCSDDAGAGAGAPTGATYITQTADGTLTAEQALGALTTGLLKNTTTTGVLSIKAPNTCTNQFPRSDDASGVWTCASVGSADITDGSLLNADINASAAIAESKLALNFPTHSNANDPTANEKAALAGTSGTAPSGSNKLVDNADNRLAALQTPSALSAASQITCTKPTQLITGSGGPVILSNAKWLVDGTYAGQSCELENSSATNTVTGPTTATIINCGGSGSVVIGKNQQTPLYVWTGSLWQQKGCMSLQQATDSGAKLIDGLTAAAPMQLRNGTDGWNFYGDSGQAYMDAVCGGSACPSTVLANSKLTINHTTGVQSGPGVAAQTMCQVIPAVAAADDNMLFGSFARAVDIKTVWCNYQGSAPTTAATFALEDGSGNAMTHTAPTCAAPGTVATAQNVTAANSLTAREVLRFDVTNTPNPATDTYMLCVSYTVTD